MSNSSRLRAIIQSKTARALDRAEDPREVLDDTDHHEAAMLQEVRRSIADIATARKRVELQGREEGARYERLGEQAAEAVQQDREDLARTALERRVAVAGRIASLRVQYDALDAQQTRLQETEGRLSERLAAFRLEKEAIKASYSASEAQVRANEAIAGISTQFDEAAARLDRAKEKIARMQARAAATEEILTTNGIPDLSGRPDADLDRQLGSGAGRAVVDQQLAALRATRGLPGPAGTGDPTDPWLGGGSSR